MSNDEGFSRYLLSLETIAKPLEISIIYQDNRTASEGRLGVRRLDAAFSA